MSLIVMFSLYHELCKLSHLSAIGYSFATIMLSIRNDLARSIGLMASSLVTNEPLTDLILTIIDVETRA